MILAINLLSSLKSDIPWVGYIIHPTVLYEIYVKIVKKSLLKNPALPWSMYTYVFHTQRAFGSRPSGASLEFSQEGCPIFLDGDWGQLLGPFFHKTLFLQHLVPDYLVFELFLMFDDIASFRMGARHPLPNLSGCSGTRGTRSNKGPVHLCLALIFSISQ